MIVKNPSLAFIISVVGAAVMLECSALAEAPFAAASNSISARDSSISAVVNCYNSRDGSCVTMTANGLGTVLDNSIRGKGIQYQAGGDATFSESEITKYDNSIQANTALGDSAPDSDQSEESFGSDN